MQLSEFFCYILLTITVTIHYADSENQKHEISERKFETKIQKRDTSLILDGYHTGKTVKQKPRVVYRRISKHRYNRKPHGISKPRVPHQKNREYISHHPPPSKHRSHSKPKYRSTKPPRPKPSFAPIEEPRYHQYARPIGFGEPPAEDNEYVNDNAHDFSQQPKYPEPPGYISKLNYPNQPVDSYGIPITTNDNQPYVQSQRYPWSPNHIDNDETQYGEETQSWQTYKRDSEPHHSYSKKHVSYAKPYDTTGDDIDFPLNSYSDVYKYGKNYEQSPFEGKMKAYSDKNKFINKPWVSSNIKYEKDQEIVGGQYAEPPARYVPRFQPSAPMFIGNDDFEPRFVDADVAASKSTSPYVNYKNSNIAFSPQNLNDAFSL